MPDNHRCHAAHCDVQVPPAMFMCLDHWRALNAKDKKQIHDTYRPGQEVDKRPSLAYLNAVEGAIHRLHVTLGEQNCTRCIVCIKANKG